MTVMTSQASTDDKMAASGGPVHVEKSVLAREFGGGPLGLGDPNDKTLRKVEIEVLIPKKMNNKAKIDKCVSEVKAFEACCKDTGLSMVIRCRKENNALKSCLSHWFSDGAFKKECTEEYLMERSEFRRTGLRTAEKKYK